MTINSASLFALGQNFATTDTSGSKSGTVSSTKHGDGTFETTFNEVNGLKTVDKTVTYADGTTKTMERTITVNPDGSKTITKTGKDGKVTTVTEMKTKNDDGTFSIAKEITHANGKTTEVSGTVSKVNGETDKTMTCTNAKGETETLSHVTTRDGDVTTHITSGTGYGGEVIYSESTWTTLA